MKAKYSTTELEEIARTANQEANSLPAAEAKPYAENEAKFVQNLVAAAKAQDSFKGEFPPEKYGPNGEMLAILAQTYRIEIPENEMSAFLVGDILDTVFFRGPGRSFDVEDGNWKLGFYFVRTRFSNKPIGNAVAFVIDRDSHDYGRIVPTYDSNIGGAFWHRIEDKQDERPGRSAGVRWVKGNKAWEVGVDSIADRLEKAFKNGGGNAG